MEDFLLASIIDQMVEVSESSLTCGSPTSGWSSVDEGRLMPPFTSSGFDTPSEPGGGEITRFLRRENSIGPLSGTSSLPTLRRETGDPGFPLLRPGTRGKTVY